MNRHRGAGLIEILIVLGMIALLVRVAWARMPDKSPRNDAERADVSLLALDLKRAQILARRLDTPQRLVFETDNAGRVVGYRAQIVAPSDGEETVREFDETLVVQPTRRRIIFLPDGTATGGCEIHVNNSQQQWQVRVDAEAGAILLREVPVD